MAPCLLDREVVSRRAVPYPALREGLRQQLVDLGSTHVEVRPIPTASQRRLEDRHRLGRAAEGHQASGELVIGAGVAEVRGVDRPAEKIDRALLVARARGEKAPEEVVERGV